MVVEPLRHRRDHKAFIDLPFRLYRDDPHWVPPLIIEEKERLDSRRHPFFKHGEVRFFLARRGDRVVGRTAAVIDRAHNAFHSEKVVGFGLTEFERDEETARALLEAVASFGADEGMEILRGPLSYSTNEECGILVDGFDRPPVVHMPYNPSWYGPMFESLGLGKARDLMAYYADRSLSMDRLGRLAERVIRRYHLHLRPLRLRHFDAEVETIHPLYNGAWQRNWGFVPMELEEFRWHAKKMKPVMIPDLALIIEVGGRPAGFIMALPDVNQVLKHLNGRLLPLGIIKFFLLRNRISGIRVVLMGILPEYRSLGAEGVLIHRIFQNGMDRGYQWAELSWVLEDNTPMRRLAENMGAKAYKRYRIFEAPVGEIKA